MVQLIHVEDAARALVEALRPEARGVYNVVGPGVVPLSAICRELGQRPVPVPHPLARPLLSRMFRWRLAHSPPEELDHIQYACAVDGGRWERELGFRSRLGLRETIRCVLGDAA